MGLRVSTVSSDVALDDLGVYLSHPTNNFDLESQFTSIELKESEDLTTAIQTGNLDVDDGSNFIHKDDYDPDEVLIQDLGIRPDELYVSNDELYSIGQTYIYSSVFPLTNSSTAASTRNVYSISGRWITWQVEVGDRVLIGGNAAAGEYTVELITDQQNFIVVEPIVDSTGGTVEILHPPGATRVGVDSTSLTQSSSNVLQDVLEDLDGAISGGGITESQHRTIDQLVHWIDEDYYQEYTHVGSRVTNIIIWTDSGKTTKIRKFQYTYSSGKVSQEIIIQYDGSGIEVERLALTYVYNGSRISNITTVRT